MLLLLLIVLFVIEKERGVPCEQLVLWIKCTVYTYVFFLYVTPYTKCCHFPFLSLSIILQGAVETKKKKINEILKKTKPATFVWHQFLVCIDLCEEDMVINSWILCRFEWTEEKGQGSFAYRVRSHWTEGSKAEWTTEKERRGWWWLQWTSFNEPGCVNLILLMRR